MSRLRVGTVIRTSYGTGPYRIIKITAGCTCPRFLDALDLGKEAPPSKPHYHLVCQGDARGNSYLNGYDENLNSVWNGDDKLIVCEEETLFLTLCCGL